MVRPLQDNEFLVRTRRGFIDVLAIANEVVTLHCNDQYGHRNAPDGAWNGVIAAAPVDFIFIQRVGAENCIGAQE